jgi:hypothetical protein
MILPPKKNAAQMSGVRGKDIRAYPGLLANYTHMIPSGRQLLAWLHMFRRYRRPAFQPGGPNFDSLSIAIFGCTMN